MTFTRRQFLAASSTGGLGIVAGCTGVADGTLSSTPATVSAAALEETGYDEREVDELVVERTVGRFGIERTVEVTNWYAEYDRSVSLEWLGLGRVQAAVVAVLSSPQVSVLGRSYNPVGEYSTSELVELIQRRYDELEDVSYVDDDTVSVLGEETRVARYEARARLRAIERSIDVYLQVTEAVEHGDDYVLCVAVYPQFGGFELESPSVRTLMEGVEHE